MIDIIQGDCRTILPTLVAASVQMICTSPPYWGQRDYEIEDQIGREATPAEFVTALLPVFAEAWRVLKEDGTLWVVIGDTYITKPHGPKDWNTVDPKYKDKKARSGSQPNRACPPGLKHKDLVGIPWRLAFALQDAGWWLRRDIIWHKPNCMVESVADRPSCVHEYVFLLSKSDKYFFNGTAIREQGTVPAGTRGAKGSALRASQAGTNSRPAEYAVYDGTRNSRDVWTIPVEVSPTGHPAGFPRALAERCILAGSRPGDTVLDPFAGGMTTGRAAARLDRAFIGIEMNKDFLARGAATLSQPSLSIERGHEQGLEAAAT